MINYSLVYIATEQFSYVIVIFTVIPVFVNTSTVKVVK